MARQRLFGTLFALVGVYAFVAVATREKSDKDEEQKKKAETRKKAKRIELKEIKVRPNIDDHDYEVKMRAIHRFFEEGDKVKVTLRFRGREMAHTHLGMELLERMRTELDAIAKVEHEPRFEGRQVVMVMVPRA